MFGCLWHLWDWLDPTSMENKKGVYTNSGPIPNNEVPINEAAPKHTHQHNIVPQHLRLMQYGLKIPNHQHPQLNQPSPHQHQPPLLNPHLHQHQRPQSPYQQSAPTTLQHLQSSPHSRQYTSPTAYQNQLIQQFAHQHLQKQQNQQNQPSHQHQSQLNYQQPVQPPPASLHSHNQLNQQNPQIWVPHQPPGHYHAPQKLKNDSQPSQYSTKPSPQVHKPKDAIERKKSAGNNNQQLRSPSAKRPAEAPVTIQGWLHKQGSEGLMLWKKRWFVLSEYCLFYYKGPEEEKLLGSILLPSYKVSPCLLEDKVNKKYAFKCEHANMRTYILAADSQEQMVQWIRVLNLACLLQNDIENESKISQSTSFVSNPSFDNSASKQQFSYTQNLRNTPVHVHSASNTTDLSNPSQQELSQYSQPLYANAPPKPRRLNDGYSSPSLEISERYSTEPKYVSSQQQQYNNQPVYISRNAIAKSPINIYGNPQAQMDYYIQGAHPQQLYQKHLHNVLEYGTTPSRDSQPQPVERRTPDTYGRSKSNPPKNRPSDYEDVYADQSMYKRPISPMAYNNSGRTNSTTTAVPLQRPYTPILMIGPKENIQYVAPQQLRKIANTIPRPHSADFLEYESKHENPNILIRQQPRPKSSLDINRHTANDNYFYSEERYAEKMRKSAQYLPKISKYPSPQNEYATHQHKKQLMYKYEPENTFPLMRSSTQPITFNDTRPLSSFSAREQPIRSRSVLSDGSLSKELDVDLRASPHERLDRETMRSPFRSRPEQAFTYNEDTRKFAIRDYDQFTRSASARLAQSNVPMDGRLVNREGERKREESMKRLLEWKQRMLQSPLNRKVNQNIAKMTLGKSNVYYRNQENGYLPLEPYIDSQMASSALPQYNSYSSDDEASGSISINTRDTFPRAISAKRMWTPTSRPAQSKSITNLARGHENDYAMSNRQQPGYFMSQGPSTLDLSSDTSQSSSCRRANWQFGDKMNVSAGELLGRTHEELVLLLIQLRRQSANTCNAIEACYNEIDHIQSKLPQMDAAKRLENLQKLEQIKQHLLELEKQYEKGKPLVNLVDNMVKLGSLYRFPKDKNNYPHVKDRLEFNQQIQERRLLAEERRDWNRLSPNHTELQAKVQQLYQLDRLIQEESETLQGLQQDKEEIERALGGLRMRLNKGFSNPAEVEQARKQQMVLENELSRVHSMLAQNSRKLEETVAGNARLEQELLVLKQKLQISRQQRSSPQISNAGDSLPCVIGTSAMLESDLHRVQQKVGDLQRQRQELSMQVRQLTDRSSNLQQLRLSSLTPTQAQGNKKKMNSLWRETDLDTMSIVDHGEYWETSVNSGIITTPLYINTDLKQSVDSDIYGRGLKSSDSASDDTSQNQNAVPQEKQEIKTVRIVKRESERRQRDREKTATGKWDPVIEEDDSSQNSSVLFRPTPVQKTQSSTNLENVSPVGSETDKSTSGVLSRQSSSSNPSLPQVYRDIQSTSSGEGSLDKTSELSPIFKSEAARQIIIEMSHQDVPKQTNRRAVPKEKRRHYTAPHNNLIMKSLNQLPTDDRDFDKMDLNIRRARDDLDMERALRQRIDAPDVVRSTLSSKELKYNESTIDNLLGTPNKIFIPERYIPEQLPQLSAEEQQYRLRKVESIKKMLSDTAIISGSSANLASDDPSSEKPSGSITSKATSKMIEEKKQREHLLQLNQILAKQVMEMSKIVAGSNNPGEQ